MRFAMSREGMQVTGKLKNVVISYFRAEEGMCKEQKSKLNDDLISRQDVIEEIALHDHTNGTEPYFSGHEVIEILKCVPTVTHAERTETHGVCSDCISRQAARNIISENYRRLGLTDSAMMELSDEVKSLPPVTPTVSEDCISREQVRAKLDYISYAEKDPISIAKRIVEDAPSVVPTTEQSSKVGEWHRVSAYKYVQHAYHFYRCSECGEENIGETNYCPNCGADMRGEQYG